jgi:ADP-heptose:LPS heptosyltransferase
MLSLAKVPMIVLFGPTKSEKFAPDYKDLIVLDSKIIKKTSDISSITGEDVLQIAEQHSNFLY